MVCVQVGPLYTSSTPDDGLELAETYLWNSVCIEVAEVFFFAVAVFISLFVPWYKPIASQPALGHYSVYVLL